MADEGLREIQLNGKQLVFLFMASTVVAVVIFLCGVMVGRGVRVLRASELGVTVADPSIDPTAPLASPLPVNSPSTPTTTEELVYPDMLGPDPPDETLVPSRPRIAPVNVRAAVPSAPAKPAPLKTVPAKALSLPAEPAGNGFVVQVAAVKDRREAETIAGRLVGKGYPSFVTTAGEGPGRMFRVRVGKYKDRREAQSTATRLQKEEQFKPWITR